MPDASDSIRKAALEAFARDGFNGASLAKIAKDADVANNLIYYHFETKDALWKASVSEGFESLQGEVSSLLEMIESTSEVDGLIDETARKLVLFATKHTELTRIALDEVHRENERGRWIASHYMVPIHKLAAKIIGMLLAKIPDGETRGYEAAQITPALYGAINFPFLNEKILEATYGEDAFSDEYIEGQIALIRVFLKALLTR